MPSVCGPTASSKYLDSRAATAETTEGYTQLFTSLCQRHLDVVQLIVSDGAEAITSTAAIVYQTANHQLYLAHWSRNPEALTPPLGRRPAEQVSP